MVEEAMWCNVLCGYKNDSSDRQGMDLRISACGGATWLVPNASSACAHAIVAVVIHSIVHVLAHSTISHLDKSYRCGRVKAS